MQYDPLELSLYLNMLEGQRVQRYGKGGKVVDFLAEVLKGGSKPTDTKRRAAMGLPQDLTPKPGEVVVKEEVKTAPKKGETSVSMTEAMNIPMSRRDVLRAGAGQAMSAMAPRGAMGALMKAAASPAELMKQVVTAPAPKVFSPLTVQGIIARGLKEGLSDQAIEKLIKKELNEEVEEWVVPKIRDPYSALEDIEELGEPAMGPLHYFSEFISKPEAQGSDLRRAMREIREANPGLYKELKEAARDTDMTVAEMEPTWSFENRLDTARDMAKKGGYPFNLEKFLDRYGYDTGDIENTLQEFGFSRKDFE